MLVKRGAFIHSRQQVNENELRDLRKKVSLLEVALHTTKHKLKDLKKQADRDLEEQRIVIEKEKDME